jgi:hypothetical protein
MKSKVLIAFSLVLLFSSLGISQINAPGVKWDEIYTFDRCNVFEIDIYAKNNELMKKQQLKTYYQMNGQNFDIKTITESRGAGMETIIDKKNEVAIQMFGGGGGAVPYYNAGGFKYPDSTELKRLDVVATDETKEIAGCKCKKYTYTYKKIFGEVWLTDAVTDIPNDHGVFRAAKMAALHNTLSVKGFVMEMTTEDAKGGKTLMTTISLRNKEDYKIELKGVEMNTAINKVNYFSF